MTTKLKECPNLECGSREIYYTSEFHRMYCSPCGTMGPWSKNKDEAETLWNTAFIRASDNPWVKIGEGELPEDQLMHLEINYRDLGQIGITQGRYIGAEEFNTVGGEFYTIDDVIRYQLIPKPGRPKDETTKLFGEVAKKGIGPYIPEGE